MAKKTSEWKIIATEGATVDGRTIAAAWINDMAEAYSLDEYPALIWPEHQRSSWGVFEGKNWGEVEELKAEKRGGLLRLLAKITPNEYLLKANADGQKLFTSIEPNLDYKGTGKCYLTGLAVTDSPASSGTTRLKFSKGSGEEVSLEYSQLEEIDFSECFIQQSTISAAIATLAKFFSSGGVLPETEQQPQEEEPMDKQQFDQVIEKLDGIETKQTTLEAAQSALAGKVDKFSAPQEPETPPEAPQQFSAEQFSAELTKQLKPLAEKVDSLETKFNKLAKEVPGQRPGEEGAGETTVEPI